jgi:trigger factor
MEERFKYKVVEQNKNVKTFEVTIEKSLEQEYYEKQYTKLSANVKIPGFRPGKAPRNVVEPKVAMDALNETINTLLPDVTVQVLVKENITPLGRIHYDLEEVKGSDGLSYKFTVHTYPEINVEKVKKIKVEAKKGEVKEDEVDAVIRNIIRSTLPPEKWRKETKAEKESKDSEAEDTERKENKVEEITVDDSFEITDEMVAELGYEDAQTLEVLKKQVRESLEKTKENQYESELLEKGLVEVQKVVEMVVPHELVHQEADHRQADFEERLAKINLKVEDYLKTQGKTMEDIHSEWEADIEKMLFRDVFAVQLAHTEKIVPTEEELDEEIDKIEDEMTRIKYKGNQNYRDQFRTMVSVNKGLERFISWIK